MTNTINFTPKKLDALRAKYAQALKVGHDRFTFEGYEMLVAYAKYLLEYLDGRCK